MKALNIQEKQFEGYFTSSGTTAQLECLYKARLWRDKNDDQRKAIVISKESYHSITRCLNILNLSMSDEVISVDFADEASVISAINEKRPWLITSTFGQTNDGMIENLNFLSEIISSQSIWHHIDAAYGGMFLMTDKYKKYGQMFDFMSSMVVDPHKGMFLSYGTGLCLYKDQKIANLEDEGSYISHSKRHDNTSLKDYSIELTKHFRALRVMFAIKFYGIEYFRSKLYEHLDAVQIIKTYCKSSREIHLGDSDLSIALFRLNTDTKTKELLDFLIEKSFYMTTTVKQGTLFIRVYLLSFRTTKEDALLLTNSIREFLA